MSSPPPPVECVRESPRAGVLLHPLRLSILHLAREPRSATEIAALLELPRQKVNYHVRELARAGFLDKAGRRRRRNLYEQRYRASAASYVLSPELLGPLLADLDDFDDFDDRMSAAYLLALSAELTRDVGRAVEEAAARDQRLATLAIRTELRFTSAAQRERFTAALRDAVARVVAEHAAPDRRRDGSAARGRPYRLVAGCYPIPPEHDPQPPSAKERP